MLTDEGTPLTGGVSSDIRLVDTPDGPIVVKRALDKLKVAADWHSDPARAMIEVKALKIAAELLGPDHVPAVLWEKPDQNQFAMSLVDPSLRNWKQDLLAGRVDMDTAATAGAVLAALHSGSAARDDIAQMFDDTGFFAELRIEPFFERVAAKHPDYASEIMAVVDQMGKRRSALVHGDYSPKNILADGARLVILDFEVAHWGDPAFDLGFCISHLLLKSMRTGADEQALLAAAQAVMDSYRLKGGNAPDDRHLVRLTGCLTLARIKGASPVDYLGDLDVDEVEEVARGLLLDPPASIRHFLKLRRSLPS